LLRTSLSEPSVGHVIGEKLDSTKADVDRLPSTAVESLPEIPSATEATVIID
jgi:hypothetical protein